MLFGAAASYDSLLNDFRQLDGVGVGGLGVEYISLQCVTTPMIVRIMMCHQRLPDKCGKRRQLLEQRPRILKFKVNNFHN